MPRTVQDQIFRQSCFLARFHPLPVHKRGTNVLAFVAGLEHPAFLSASTANQQDVEHAVTHRNEAATFLRFAARVEDHAIVPVDVLNAHPVEFASISHSGIAHHYDDVLERLLGYRQELAFGFIIEPEKPALFFEEPESRNVTNDLPL